MKKLTNDEIETKLSPRSIKMLDEYVNQSVRGQFQCLIDQYIWSAVPKEVFAGSGCPKCGYVSRTLTNQILEERLRDRNVKCLEDYVNSKTPLWFQCTVDSCQYKWKSKPNSLFNGTGCPKCAHRIKLTNQDIDDTLNGRNISRLEDFIDTLTPILFGCNIDSCEHKWRATPNNIRKGRGCPKCSGLLKQTNDDIDGRLKDRNITRIGNYINITTPILFKCDILECFHEWKAAPNNILNSNQGCPKCSNHIPLTNEDIDRRLVGRNITRLNSIINTRSLMDFWCDICCHKWTAKVNSVIINETGCPECSLGKNERTIRDYLTYNGFEFEYQKDIRKLIDSETRKIRVDFYFQRDNTIVEYNGCQHYRPTRFGNMNEEQIESAFIRQQERDQYLQYFCDRHSISLIWIDGRTYQFTKLVTHIESVIAPQLLNSRKSDER